MQKSRLAQRKLGLQKEIKPKKKFNLKFVIIPGFIVTALILVFFMLAQKTWDGNSKLTVAIQKQDGTGEVVILDPSSSSITTIEIPANTVVDASHQLGTWKFGSITKLGQNENLGGDFLKNTIIKSFNFPIDDWASENFLNVISGNILKSTKAIFNNNDTNLSFIDEIRVALFSLPIGNNQRININLKNSSYLRDVRQKDGSEGLEIGETMPGNLESYLVDPFISQSNLNVLINNGSHDSSTVDTVVKTIEVLGANVSSVQNSGNNTDDCKVIGIREVAVNKIAKIFDCKVSLEKANSNFDIEVDFGTKFKERF